MDFDFDTSSILNVLILDPGSGSLTVSGSKSIVLPNGTVAERPSTPGAGATRFNTDNSSVEFYDGAQWQTFQTQAGGSGALSNFANMTTPGILVQTSAGQYAARTITGVAGNITVTNGDGISGNPTIGLATTGTAGTYVTVTTDDYGRVSSGSTSQDWSTISGTPTTLAGYGITDAYTMAQTANLTWSWSSITSTPTTLAGYGITDAASDLELATHAGNVDLHLTSAQNTWLDAITVSSTEVNYLSGVTSNIQTQLGGKLSLTGGTMSGNIVMDSGTHITVTDSPVNATDAVNKTYVDSLVSGLSWRTPVDSVGASLPGTATTGDRFLNTTDGKIYTATATDTWDAGTTPADGWAVFDRATETGYVYSGSAWVQFTGAGQVTAGLGLSKTGNQIDVNLGAGIVELPSDEIGVDLYASGGLGLVDPTTGNVSVLTDAQVSVLAADGTITVGGSGIKVSTNSIDENYLTTSVAGTGLTGGNGSALSLTTTGVGTGTYNNVTVDLYGRVTAGSNAAYLLSNENITVTGDATGSGTTAIALTLASVGTAGTYVSVTTDAKGRVTAGSTTQAWSTLTGTPTTLAGYGITDAVKNNGSVPTFQSGTFASMPAAGTTGAMFVTSDTNSIYRDNGTSWVQVGEAGLLYTENASTPTASTVTGANAVSIGSGNTASSANALATGAGSKTNISGGEVRANGSFSNAGDAQSGKYVLRAVTSTSAVTEMFTDGTAGQLVLPNNTTWAYTVLITGRRTDTTGENAGFKIEGVVSRDASASTTALVGNRSRTVLTRPNGSWDADVYTDTTNGALTVKVTGENSKTVRWVATVITTEVTN